MRANVEIELAHLSYDNMLEFFASIIAEDEFILSRYGDFDVTISCSRSKIYGDDQE